MIDAYNRALAPAPSNVNSATVYGIGLVEATSIMNLLFTVTTSTLQHYYNINIVNFFSQARIIMHLLLAGGGLYLCVVVPYFRVLWT